MTAFENLSLLRAFVCIVECGSISAGARRLKISQPTLSRQLRTLEDHCGAPLLQRDTHAMCLTPIGRSLLADARTMLAHAEEAEQRLRQDQMELSGHLRLFATIDWGQWVVTPMLSSFLQLHPRVTAELALTNRPLHMLREGCDIGILPGKITDESVVARPAGMIGFHLVAAPSLIKKHPVAKRPADLKSWPWISISGFQFWSSKEVTLAGRGGVEQTLPISPILISEGVTSLREAARTGLGLALMPDWLIEEDLRSKHLAHVLPQWRPKDLPLHVVYAGQRLLPARVSAFIDFAVADMSKVLAAYP
ncbi:transcriptional regulator, LysR family [Chthoniobacter flavus Ellin428]|uniref:Transcriptional regulator, LysR family n=1 Tax=Chthoniobacter flavus Ellin428 TaxID=497964 RepID=B4D9M2_9BACT|nr:LysR family transcriptional regulator [Chthoniobacter flavus]EDY16803.1 transcriptional regulator, LysR family [Chthoniobacter flavus Ellin428]TCO93372.1 LysR family transcriptional regulator [Chthoniobacter flavus]